MITTYDAILYKQSENAEIKIHEDGDGLGMVVVKTTADYWGAIDFSMDADDAVDFANAILKVVAMMKERKQ